MNYLVVLLFTFFSYTTFAYEYPDAKRDREDIGKAFAMEGIKDLKNLEFPLGKQVFTGPFTALIKIPELAGYLTGLNKEGFYTFHVITFEAKGMKHACVASVLLAPDDSKYVEVANCGKDSWKFMNNERMVSKKMVVSPRIKSGTSQPTKKARE